MRTVLTFGAAGVVVFAAMTATIAVVIAARVADAACGIADRTPSLDPDAAAVASWREWNGMPVLSMDEHTLAERVAVTGGERVPPEIAYAALAGVAVDRARRK